MYKAGDKVKFIRADRDNPLYVTAFQDMIGLEYTVNSYDPEDDSVSVNESRLWLPVADVEIVPFEVPVELETTQAQALPEGVTKVTRYAVSGDTRLYLSAREAAQAGIKVKLAQYVGIKTDDIMHMILNRSKIIAALQEYDKV